MNFMKFASELYHYGNQIHVRNGCYENRTLFTWVDWEYFVVIPMESNGL